MAPKRVLLIGGYGNYGARIAGRLADDGNIQLIVAGRDGERAQAFAATLDAAHPAEALALDIAGDLAPLAAARPDVVIHAAGPFQGQSYRVAEACIAAGSHYLDLADDRAFVAGIGTLDARAREAGVAVIAGASSTPALTAAIVDRYRPRFARLDSIDSGISAAEQGSKGFATAAGALSYVGRLFRAWRDGEWRTVHGWQGLAAVAFPGIGRRWLGEADVADQALFPARYAGVASVRFGAGHELKSAHLLLWLLSWPVRAGLLPSLARMAPLLVRAGRLFDPFGSGCSGLRVELAGAEADGGEKRIRAFLIARRGDGAFIPCIPAILLARRIARGDRIAPGARPCLDLIGLDDYLAEMAGLDISLHVEGDDA